MSADGEARPKHPTHNATRAILTAALTLGLAIAAARAAGPMTPEQILNALTPKPVSRSLSAPTPDAAPAPDQSKFVNSLRNRTTRSITLDERQELATIAKNKPAIDIEIDFADPLCAKGIGRDRLYAYVDRLIRLERGVKRT